MNGHRVRPVVVVTGASGGIGAAVVDLLTASGYQVRAVDRVASAADRVRPELVREGLLDVSDEARVAAFAEELAADLDREEASLVGLVNAAGVVHAVSLLETSLAEWERVFAVNARGTFLMTRAVARTMVAQRERDSTNERSVVTVASNAGSVPRTEFGAYGAAKAAAASVTRSFGLQLAPHGIRCNVVSPGTTRTAMVTSGWGGQDHSDVPVAGSPETYRLGIPLGRIAEPEDIAELVRFLLSPAARHITLQNITADGGATF